jgi:hypothetical protein
MQIQVWDAEPRALIRNYNRPLQASATPETILAFVNNPKGGDPMSSEKTAISAAQVFSSAFEQPRVPA